MSLHEGQTVGPYQVIGQLGQGGMAMVYKAYHAKLDRFVAIKVMHKAFSEEPDFLARFEREAQIVAKLEHPHIVPVYDYSELDGEPYLVMKYIEGRTLKKILSEGSLPLDEIMRIMTDVASALTYAHQHGVLHRDVKPSNIVIGNDGMVYLTDFGLARMAQLGASTMSNDMILGTPQYISPEQASGQKNLDAHTDIYSLGVVLYEMVVGRVPFNADTPYAIVHDQIYSELPLPSAINPAVPQPVEAVLIKALAKKPEFRYDSADGMMVAFRAAATKSNLVAVDSDRKQAADSASAQQPRAMDDSPTIPPEAPSVPNRIPSPIPPTPPTPPVPPDGKKSSKRVVVERQFDLSNPRGDIQVNMGDLPKRMEDGIRKVASWGERMAAQVEEAAKEGAKAAAYKAAASAPDAEEARIRKRIEKRYRERQGLLSHLFTYVIVNIVLWCIWYFASPVIPPIPGMPAQVQQLATTFPWPMFVTLFWGIGMVAHLLSYNEKYGRGAEQREDAIQREIDRARERSAAYEKPKNERRAHLELTDDGEIQEVYEDEASRADKRKRGR